MKRARIWYFISVVSGALFLLVLVFYFFIEAYGNGFAAGLLALFLAIVNLVSLIYSSSHGHHKTAFGQGLLLVVFVISIFFSVSRTLWFGLEADSFYLGEDAGFQRITFYNRGTCIVERGGIGGVHKINYGKYEISGSVVYVPEGWNPYYPLDVKIDGKIYNVRPSANLSGVIEE